MAITRQEIEHIAVLARLEMSGERFDHLADDMQNIVGMVDKLQQLDLGDITDVINTERKNALREDVVHQELRPKSSSSPTRPTSRRAAWPYRELWNKR